MDIFDLELLRFWKILNNNEVAYIMVGGFAVNLHGFSRATEDCDIWLKDTIENRKHLRKAFIELGYGDFPVLETMSFVAGWTQFFVSGSLTLDMITTMKGLEELTFEECFNVSKKANLEGIVVPFLHINHLLANKKAVNRPKDQIDVLELERIKNYLEQKG